jgi:predicted hydrolase (HD superfamily)
MTASEIYDKYVRQNPVQTLTKSRDESLALMHAWVSSDALRKHMLAVEAAMIAYAGKFGEDAGLWGATGLLHDFDYEKNPTRETHVLAGIPVLAEAGYPAPMLDAIMGHADYLGIPRQTNLSKTLFAVDELCGLLTALAYVRPTKTLEGSEPGRHSQGRRRTRRGFSRARDGCGAGAGAAAPVASACPARAQ